MVTVEKLISKLQKMPQHLHVVVEKFGIDEHTYEGAVISIYETADDYDPEKKGKFVAIQCWSDDLIGH